MNGTQTINEHFRMPSPYAWEVAFFVYSRELPLHSSERKDDF